MRWGRPGRPGLPERLARAPLVAGGCRQGGQPASVPRRTERGAGWNGLRALEGGKEGTGRGLPALVVGVSVSVCLSVPSGFPRAPGAPGAAPAPVRARRAVARGAHRAAAAVAKGGPFLSLVI